MKEILHNYRFEAFFITLMLLMFGSLLFPFPFFNKILHPILVLLNMLMGIVLIFSKGKKKGLKTIGLLSISAIIFSTSVYNSEYSSENYKLLELFRLGMSFFFYLHVTISLIQQVLEAKLVNKTVIFGLIAGFICLGFVGFFIFLSIEVINPNSFNGIVHNSNTLIDSMLYYSYITLLTIGFGDITPATAIAQKATILVALVGQFYLVIVMAIVIEKYIRQNKKN